MNKNNPLFIVIACVWLLPFSSVQLLPFGIPLYPIEIILLVAFPFLFTKDTYKIFSEQFTQKIAIFSLILFCGAGISFLFNPGTLIGLGQLKSFFFFPVLFWLFATSALSEFECRSRLLWHLRWMFFSVAATALFSVFSHGLTYDSRLNAWFDSPNLLAMLLLPGVILWSAFLVLKRKRTSFFEGISWGVVMTAFLATQSYSAFLAAFLAGVVFLWISREYVHWKGPALRIMILGALFIGGLLFVNGERGAEKWTSLITGDERSSFSSRKMIWSAAIKMLQDSPATGIGPGRFQSTYLEYQRFYPPYLEWAVPHPHNLFFALWLSSGILGAIASIWLCFFLFSALKEIPSKKEKALMGALFFGLFVSGLFDVPYFRAEFCFLFWLELALFSGMLLRKKGSCS
ncbi:MAG: O-antigen ligase family protein [Candidatus Moranbacteria bacterium]|nr:O-antigen ligase family protein [Candidatus Moranbacteria bacterium]MBP9801299.1 O-antigen ligase family protein [Candidatus Moranbacteria bacterium]